MGRPFIDLFFTFRLLLLPLVENKISFADGKSADEILVVVVADFQKLVSLLFRQDQLEDFPFHAIGLPGSDFVCIVTSDDADLENMSRKMGFGFEEDDIFGGVRGSPHLSSAGPCVLEGGDFRFVSLELLVGGTINFSVPVGNIEVHFDFLFVHLFLNWV